MKSLLRGQDVLGEVYQNRSKLEIILQQDNIERCLRVSRRSIPLQQPVKRDKLTSLNNPIFNKEATLLRNQ